ncbi:MAG: lipopolysaccharide biosynthesis protein [Thermoplasmata archaeon]
MGAAGVEPADGWTDPERPKPRGLGLSSSAVFLIIIVIQFIAYVPTYFLGHGIGSVQLSNGAKPGQALLGTIQLFLLIAASVNSIGDLRIGSAFTYFVSRGESPRHGLTTYLYLRLLLVGISGAALFILGPTLGIALGDRIAIFGVWLLFPLCWSVSTAYMQTWVALGDSVRSQVPQLLEAIVRAGVLTFAAIDLVSVQQPTQTLWEMTAAYAIGIAASTVVSIPTVWSYRGRFRASEGSRMLRWAWPLMGSLLLLYISSNLIQFVVAAQLGTVGLNNFSAANGFRILALAIPTAVALPLFPHLVGLHKRREYEAIRAGTWQALRYTAFLVVPGVVALVIYRVTVLNLFYGGVYAGTASTALALLALASIPAALSQVIGTALNSIGRQRLELYLTSVQVGVLFVAAPLLIAPPDWLSDLAISGINGAALAVLLSSAAALALNTYFMERHMAVRIRLRPIATICVSAAVSFLAISRLNALININRYYSFAGGVALGFAAYVLMLILLGELTKADVDQIGRSFGVPRALTRPIERLCWKAASPEMAAIVPGTARGLVDTEEDPLGRSPPPKEPK